ncbi:MAG: energy-coupling factor ABC transporter permease [Spirochaetes bacterium]|nr:energy-coupling factor ABC transporter permease [Spirochaetota bacterium]
MHMADALLSVAVGGTMYAASAAAIGYSIAKIKKDEFYEKKIPIMAVAGAFIFAAQMIDIAIPGTGSSGHIGGGILLAALLGAFPALLTISAVLIIQCLFFADGGLLALGSNIFNLGVIPCLFVYPLLFRPILKKEITPKAIWIASIAAVVVGLQLGAFGVVLQTQASGITALPFATFALFMQPIHLLIGIGEGIITASVLCFVYKMQPEILDRNTMLHESCSRDRDSGQEQAQGDESGARKKAPLGNLIITLAIITIAVGGGVSIFTSTNPTGLEWAIERTAGAGAEELESNEPLTERLAIIQETTAFMPDYDYRFAGEDGSLTGTSVAGIAGSILTFLLAGGIAWGISAVKKKRRSRAAAS